MYTEKKRGDKYDVGVKCTYIVQNRPAGMYNVNIIMTDTTVQGMKVVSIAKSESKLTMRCNESMEWKVRNVL